MLWNLACWNFAEEFCLELSWMLPCSEQIKSHWEKCIGAMVCYFSSPEPNLWVDETSDDNNALPLNHLCLYVLWTGTLDILEQRQVTQCALSESLNDKICDIIRWLFLYYQVWRRVIHEEITRIEELRLMLFPSSC